MVDGVSCGRQNCIVMYLFRTCFWCFVAHCIMPLTSSLPVGKLNASRSEIKHGELLPPDHVPGAHMEHDGDINKDFHHEAFLGTLIQEGKLAFENLAGYKKLIDIYHKVDTDGNHQIDENELKNWIHERILEHYDAAKEESDGVFNKIDHNNDGFVLWAEYKAQLLGLDPVKFEDDNTTLHVDKSGEFSPEVKHWIAADHNKDNKLDRQEFLAFHHPEHNKITIGVMADEFLRAFDSNKDEKISLEEFITLPGGEVDEEDAELDRQYQQEREKEFKEDMDIDNDGFVTRDELLTYFDPRHMQHAVKEAQYLIKTSDRNLDRTISEHEMLMNYETFTGSGFSNFARLLHDEF